MADEPSGITSKQGHLWLIPVEGTMSTDTLVHHPERWLPYAIDLGPCVAGPISFGPGDEEATDGQR